MDDTFSKRYSLVEIALLGFFVLALVLAQFLVHLKQRVTLSEPISLAGSGLTVRKPVGRSWESMSHWQYESDNSLTLVSQLMVDTRHTVEVEVCWRYTLCGDGSSPQEILSKRAEQAGAVFGDFLTLDTPVEMVYAPVRSIDGAGRVYYIGLARLDHGRMIELQVMPKRMGSDYGERLFKTLAASIVYQPSPQLEAGRVLVSLLHERFSGMIADSGPTTSFIIRNLQQTPVGYSFTEATSYGAAARTQRQLNSRFYVANESLIESTFLSQSDLTAFSWKSRIQLARMNEPRAYTVRREADGLVQVEKDSGEDHSFVSNDLLVPELFLPQAGELFLKQADESALVDVMASTGFVVPTLLEKMDPAQALARADEIAAVVKVRFLNHPKSFEEYYFNADGSLIGRLEQQPNRPARLWERSTAGELRQIFGDSFPAKSETVARRSD